MSRRPPGPATPAGGQDANLGLGLGIIVVMLVVGFLILHSFGGSGQTALTAGTGPTGSDQPRTSNRPSTTLAATTTTSPLRDPSTIKVLVANGTQNKNAATKVKQAIAPAGYNLLAPVSATATYLATNAKTTEMLVQSGYEREATLLANELGIPTTALTAFPPEAQSFPIVVTPTTKVANIIIVVGTDLATTPPSPLPAAPGGVSSTSIGSSSSVRTTTTLRRPTTTKAVTTTTKAAVTTTVKP
jgi:hypothetical protein